MTAPTTTPKAYHEIQTAIQLLEKELKGRIEYYPQLFENGKITKAEANRRWACLATLKADLSGEYISNAMRQPPEDIKTELQRWASAVQSQATLKNKYTIARLRERILSMQELIG